MVGRRVGIYYAWSRPGEVGAPLEIIENRFPTLFESRRMVYPRFAELSDPARFDQSVAGFLDHIMKANFAAFIDQARVQTGNPVIEFERVRDDGTEVLLDDALLVDLDTLFLISFDSVRTGQEARNVEVAAVRRFLDDPDHLLFVCPHHDIGDAPDLSDDARLLLQQAEFLHHGDRTIPPQQRFGGLARSLLAGLGVPVQNRFGLRPGLLADGSPAPIEIERTADRLDLLAGVDHFNRHPHLPHLQPIGDAIGKLEVVVRQPIDLAAPPHPFTAEGRTSFDALLQSRPAIFPGSLLVSDTTLWSSTAGGVDGLRRFWTNVVQRPHRPGAGRSA